MAGYIVAGGILRRVDALRSAETMQVLDADELNTIAATMEDPRQCGRCAFGPVDHTGCSDLWAHHNEQNGRCIVSNACPRCGWFARSIRNWPRYNPRVRTPAGQAVYRRRVWGEVVVAVRATAKVRLCAHA